MNNEPVAYLMVDRNDGNSYIQMGVPTRDEKISHQPYPLYAHPVKDKPHPKCDEACMYLCQMRELTNAEILWLADEYSDEENLVADCVGFARAIIRKAQEK